MHATLSNGSSFRETESQSSTTFCLYEIKRVSRAILHFGPSTRGKLICRTRYERYSACERLPLIFRRPERKRNNVLSLARIEDGILREEREKRKKEIVLMCYRVYWSTCSIRSIFAGWSQPTLHYASEYSNMDLDSKEYSQAELRSVQSVQYVYYVQKSSRSLDIDPPSSRFAI